MASDGEYVGCLSCDVYNGLGEGGNKGTGRIQVLYEKLKKNESVISE